MAQDINNPPAGGFKHGGWYWDPSINEARQYNKDTGFGGGTTINNPEQVGYGERVSKEVQAQSGYVAEENANVSRGVQSLMGGNGGSSVPGTPQGPSGINIQDVYNQAYNSDEIKGAQSEVDTVDTEINELRKQADEEIARVNDNPFFSEARRKGEIAKIDNKFNSTTQTLLQKKQLASEKLAQLRGDAEAKVNLALKQYDINRQEYQDQLQRFNFLLESGALNNASGSQLGTIASSLGISPSMVQGILEKQSTANVSPQIITNTDANGNVTFSVIDKNTGRIINQNSLGAVGKPSSSGSSSSRNNNIADQFVNMADSLTGGDVNGVYVGVFPQLVKEFAPVMSLQDIYKTYLNTGVGKKYGTPKEDSAQIKELYDFYRGDRQEEEDLFSE